ncbi:MAG: anthranilate synthase component I family protein [Pirellulales bacterium]
MNSRSASSNEQLPLVERLHPGFDAVDAFRRLAALPHVVFFDSAMRHPTLGRYSFVAADPVDWLDAPADGSDALQRLAGRLAELPTTSRPDLPPFQGGVAGMFGYELGRSLEKIPAAAIDEFQIPALAVGLYDVVVAFDHEQSAAWLISQGFPETDPQARCERAAARLAEFRARLAGGSSCPNVRSPEPPALTSSELAPKFAVPASVGLTSNFSADAYRRAVRQAIEYVHAGDVFQVNLAQRLLHPAHTSAVDLYCRLRERNAAPFAGFLDGSDWQVASASPERFVRVADCHVETRPIKGTRGRAHRPEADLFSGDELRASEKDRAENVMIVDLMRNDLSRTCRPESVRVSQLCGLETYAYVQHLVSVVEGTLRGDATPLDLLSTCFPGGSVTGAPKVRAMEIIAELEPTARGAYCGSLGYIGVDGRMDTSILIRTITAARGWWQLPVGGGIVAQSNPHDEYDETWHKAAGLIRALAP